jgi:hypothetical protein
MRRRAAPTICAGPSSPRVTSLPAAAPGPLVLHPADGRCRVERGGWRSTPARRRRLISGSTSWRRTSNG